MRFFLFFIVILAKQQAFSGIEVPRRSHLPENDSFPKPTGVKDMLFYIQRTPNINTIIYALNKERDGSLNKEEPVHIFWIRFAEDGTHKELSLIQQNYAYGLKSTKINDDNYELRFVSYKKYVFYLKRSNEDKTFKAYTLIGDKLCILNRVFVSLEGGTFWFPHVVYVEITGTDPDTGKEVITRFKP
jgi:hypothetical protein